MISNSIVLEINFDIYYNINLSSIYIFNNNIKIVQPIYVKYKIKMIKNCISQMKYKIKIIYFKKKKNIYIYILLFRIIIIYMQIISYIINKFGEIITNNTINNSKLIHYYKE